MTCTTKSVFIIGDLSVMCNYLPIYAVQEKPDGRGNHIDKRKKKCYSLIIRVRIAFQENIMTEKDTQAKLIESATSLFAQRGYAAVSIRELADAAQVNSALISYHFGSKEGLYLAVLENQFRPITGLLQQAAQTTMSPEERIVYYAKGVYEIHKSRPFLIRFLHSELTNPTTGLENVVKRYIGQIYPFLYQAFAEGVASRQFNAALNPGYAVLSLVGIMNFYFIAKPIAREFLTVDNEHDKNYLLQAVQIYLHGIKDNNYNS